MTVPSTGMTEVEMDRNEYTFKVYYGSIIYDLLKDWVLVLKRKEKSRIVFRFKSEQLVVGGIAY